MDEFESKIEALMEHIENKQAAIDKDLVVYATDIELTRSLIHVIDAIGKNPGANITELAGIKGALKSTISRQISELERKGYIEKYRIPTNKKDIYVKLTPLGQRAFQAHLDFHEKRRYLCFEKMDTYSVREKELIVEFLTLYRDSLYKYYNSYECEPRSKDSNRAET